MRTHLLIITLLFGLCQSFAQLSRTDEQYLRESVMQQVNELRKGLGAGATKSNSELRCAAINHATYMAKTDKLSHTENSEKRRTVLDRVEHCKDESFNLVGENISCFEPPPVAYSKEVLDAMAARIFRLWKDSNDHYWNMVNPAFTHCDYAFKYCSKSKLIYCAQVLGSRSD